MNFEAESHSYNKNKENKMRESNISTLDKLKKSSAIFQNENKAKNFLSPITKNCEKVLY